MSWQKTNKKLEVDGWKKSRKYRHEKYLKGNSLLNKILALIEWKNNEIFINERTSNKKTHGIIQTMI